MMCLPDRAVETIISFLIIQDPRVNEDPHLVSLVFDIKEHEGFGKGIFLVSKQWFGIVFPLPAGSGVRWHRSRFRWQPTLVSIPCEAHDPYRTPTLGEMRKLVVRGHWRRIVEKLLRLCMLDVPCVRAAACFKRAIAA